VANDPTFVTFLVGAIAGMGTFIAYLVRTFIGDLQKSRDRSLTMAEGSTVAMDRLTAEIGKLRGELEKRR
jgi:hypothetical protein